MTPEVAALPFISKYKGDQEAFGQKVISVSKDLDILPESLMIVMNNESGMNPAAKNPKSSASGLIQFMESTYIGLGTTSAALRSMDGVKQMDYVYRYLKTYSSRMEDTADVYLAVFFPKALFENDAWEFPSWAAKANPIFDINKDGKLTKAEFKQYVNTKYAQYIPVKKAEDLKKKRPL